MIDMHAEIFAKLAQFNRDWFDRAKSEARLASKLSAKLTAAHSIPDATAGITPSWPWPKSADLLSSSGESPSIAHQALRQPDV
jgi:hypothetical protein